MLKTALKVLNKIEKHGFKAYIVGGYVRDYLLNRESLDIDIATNATPMEIKQIFNDIFIGIFRIKVACSFDDDNSNCNVDGLNVMSRSVLEFLDI